MATVYRNGHSRHVANLGWLLRNCKAVRQISVMPLYADESSDCRMRVLLEKDVVYICTWADKALCWKWLQRSVFIGVDLTWFDFETQVTKGQAMP